MGLKHLPPPDHLHWEPAANSVCVITETPLGKAVGAALAARGFATASLPIRDEAHTWDAVQQIAEDYSGVAALIHVQPPTEQMFDPAEKAMIKQVFLIAKHLKKLMLPTARVLLAMQMDGKLGMGDQPFGVIGGGLIGLAKTLRQEWDFAACRAVDLSPALSQSQAVDDLLAEFFDPNRRMAEVGWSADGRVTLC